jgi:hypothetical protein
MKIGSGKVTAAYLFYQGSGKSLPPKNQVEQQFEIMESKRYIT